MQILVNNKPAAIKKDSSFEVNMMSALFTDSETFSLNIEFPMDIKENRAIFGSVVGLNAFSANTYNCVIISGKFSIDGYLQVLSYSDNMLSCQFVNDFSSNLSANMLSNYIDEIEVGKPSEYIPENEYYHSTEQLGLLGFALLRFKCEEETYNHVFGYPGGDMECLPSYQVYLWKYLSLLSSAIGYSISEIPVSEFRYLLCCNGTFSGWHLDDIVDQYELDICKYMPHWTIKDFLDKLCNMFGCKVNISHINKTITFTKLNGSTLPTVNISRNIMQDNFNIETQDDAPNYKAIVGYRFPQEGDAGKYNDCNDFLDNVKKYHRYIERNLISKFVYDIRHQAGEYGYPEDNPYYWQSMVHVKDVDLWFAKSAEVQDGVWQNQKYQLFEIANQLHVYGYEQLNDLDIIPVTIASTDKDFNEYGLNPSYEVKSMVIYESHHDLNEEDPNMKINEELLDYKVSDTIHDKLYIAIFDSSSITYQNRPVPSVCEYEVLTRTFKGDDEEDTYYTYLYSVTQRSHFLDINSWQQLNLPSIDTSKKYTVKLVTNDIYDVNSIFIIDNVRYVCKNIKISVNANDVSAIKELELYRIDEVSTSIASSARLARRNTNDSGAANESGSGTEPESSDGIE